MKIGNIELENNIILAPMAGITNLGYRRLMKRFGCGLVVSEMISDFALIYNNKETFDMLKTLEEERPLAIQLFGGSKESILQGEKILFERADFDILDINLGCPVPKVIKGNAGSSWLKPERQEELYEMMKAVVENSPKPVTAKIRLGWDDNSINVVETCKILEKAGVSMIAIHGRTRTQFYMGTASYDPIKEAKAAVSIPVVANGDIDSVEKANYVLDYTKADGIMVGRYSLGNPILIKQLSEAYTGNDYKDINASLIEQLGYIKDHYMLVKEQKGEYRTIAEMRGLAPHYLKGYPACKPFKAKLSQMHSEEELFAILDEIKEMVNNGEIDNEKVQ